MSPVPVPGGGVFWAPLPPSPLPPRGSGFPQGPGASRCPNSPPCAFRPASRLPLLPGDRRPGARASRSTSRMPGPGFQASMLPSVRGWCPGIRPASPCFQGTGDRCPQSGGFQTFRRPCFQEARLRTASRGPGIFELFFFATFAPFVFASQPPGFRFLRDR